MNKRRMKQIVGVLIAVVLLYIIYAGVTIWTYSTNSSEAQTDAAIVLGAAVWNDKPSPVFKERIHHAIALYEQGIVKNLIFKGGKGDELSLSEAQVAKNYAIAQGVPEADIFIETKSTITEENLQYALEIGKTQHFQSYTIVSDPLHMKRAMTMANDLGMTAKPSPTTTSAYKTFQTKIPFFLREVFYYGGYQLTKPFRSH